MPNTPRSTIDLPLPSLGVVLIVAVIVILAVAIVGGILAARRGSPIGSSVALVPALILSAACLVIAAKVVTDDRADRVLAQLETADPAINDAFADDPAELLQAGDHRFTATDGWSCAVIVDDDAKFWSFSGEWNGRIACTGDPHQPGAVDGGRQGSQIGAHVGAGNK